MTWQSETIQSCSWTFGYFLFFISSVWSEFGLLLMFVTGPAGEICQYMKTFKHLKLLTNQPPPPPKFSNLSSLSVLSPPLLLSHAPFVLPSTQLRINLLWATDSFTLKPVCVDGTLVSATVCFGSVPMLWDGWRDGRMWGGVAAALFVLNRLWVERDSEKMVADFVSSIVNFFLWGSGRG